ncbi:unnamed protein product [Closterium sp. NIES-54]
MRESGRAPRMTVHAQLSAADQAMNLGVKVGRATHNEVCICGGLVGGGLELGLKGRVARRGRERRGLAGVVRFGGGEGMGAAEDDVKDAVGGDPCIGEDSSDAADERVPVNGRFVGCKLWTRSGHESAQVAAAGGAAMARVRKRWGGGGVAQAAEVGAEVATRLRSGRRWRRLVVADAGAEAVLEAAEGSGAGGGWWGRGDAVAEAASRP